MVCKMTWGLIFCFGILGATCPGDAKAAVAAQAEEKRMGRGLGRVKVTCNDTLIVLFLVGTYLKGMMIAAEAWPGKGTVISGQDMCSTRLN